MQLFGQDWQQFLWRLVSNPTFEVIAVAAVVGVALVAMFNTESIYRTTTLPLLFGYR